MDFAANDPAILGGVSFMPGEDTFHRETWATVRVLGRVGFVDGPEMPTLTARKLDGQALDFSDRSTGGGALDA